MDPITHMLTGGLIAQSSAKRGFLKQATFIGMLSAASPDLDFFVHSSTNPLLNLEFHRSFTHSFAFIPIGGIIATLFFLLLFKSWRPRWKEVWGLSTLAYATHSLLDACTSYGTQIFWPFSSDRVSWDILPIVEPIFTTILLLGVVITCIMHSQKIARYALIMATLYIGLAIFQHHRAMDVQKALITMRHQDSTIQNRALPRFGTIYRWDSLYIYHQRIYMDTIYTPFLASSYTVTNLSLPLFDPFHSSIIPASSLSSVKTFIWFTQNYTTALSYNPLILVDLRYIQKLPHYPRALWGISWNFNKANQMKELHFIPLRRVLNSTHLRISRT